MSPLRREFLDILPVIASQHAELFIKNQDVGQLEVNWKLFLEPLAIFSWISIIVCSLIISLIISIHNGRFSSMYFFNFIAILKSNFGGKSIPMTDPLIWKNVTIFISLITGMLIWISYRASFTSKLSVIKHKLPFRDPSTLLETNYR